MPSGSESPSSVSRAKRRARPRCGRLARGRRRVYVRAARMPPHRASSTRTEPTTIRSTQGSSVTSGRVATRKSASGEEVEAAVDHDRGEAAAAGERATRDPAGAQQVADPSREDVVHRDAARRPSRRTGAGSRSSRRSAASAPPAASRRRRCRRRRSASGPQPDVLQRLPDGAEVGAANREEEEHRGRGNADRPPRSTSCDGCGQASRPRAECAPSRGTADSGTTVTPEGCVTAPVATTRCGGRDRPSPTSSQVLRRDGDHWSDGRTSQRACAVGRSARPASTRRARLSSPPPRAPRDEPVPDLPRLARRGRPADGVRARRSSSATRG